MIDNFKRILGLPSCLAAAVGIIVAQSTATSVLQGVGLAGNGFILAMIGACILVLCSSISFCELSMMLPRAGGLSSYAEIAMGHFPAMVAVISGYLVVSILAVPAELALLGMVFDHLFPGMVSPLGIGLLALVLVTLLNVTGTGLFARFQTVLTVIMMVTLVGLGVAGWLAPPQTPAQEEPFNPMGWSVFALIPLAIWAFMGGEFVCSLVEETKNPQRNIPVSIFLAIFISLGVYIVFAGGTAVHLPKEVLGQSDMPHVMAADAVLGRLGLMWIGIAGLAATISSINTVLATAPRMLYGMAHAGQAPAFFQYLHPRFHTPWVAIITLAFAMVWPLIWTIRQGEKVMMLLVSASLCWLIAYLIAHSCVVALRLRRPDLPRPFKTPLYPLPQVVGVLGVGYVLFNASPDPEMAAQVYRGAGLLLGATLIYSACWVRFKMKKPLFEPVSFEQAMNE